MSNTIEEINEELQEIKEAEENEVIGVRIPDSPDHLIDDSEEEQQEALTERTLKREKRKEELYSLEAQQADLEPERRQEREAEDDSTKYQGDKDIKVIQE